MARNLHHRITNQEENAGKQTLEQSNFALKFENTVNHAKNSTAKVLAN